MGTRCNVIIESSYKSEPSTLILYRHWDGMPQVVGVNIRDCIQEMNACPAEDDWHRACVSMANRFLAILRPATTYNFGNGPVESPAKPRYSLTDCIHSDIDHLYKISITEGDVTIWYACGYDQPSDDRREPERWELKPHTFAEWSEFVKPKSGNADDD